DRKEAEQENLRLKERLQFMLASSSAIIYSCKPYEPYEATFMSENIEAILGYSAEEFTTQDNFWANHLHPEDAPRVFSKLSALFEVGTHTHEYRFLHKKGYYIWLRDQLCLVRDEQGNPLEIIGSCFDISDRKQAEAEGKEFNRRWRSVLDKIQMIVIELDLDGNVQYINLFFLKISGFAPEEVINKHWITHFVSSGHQLSLETVFQEILEEINNEYYVNPILTKSGEERIISWHNSVLKDKQGQSIGVISLGEDITEKHRLEKIKSEFLSIVSHELKTPLTTIQASLSLLSEKIIDPASEDGEMIISLATDGVDRLVRLVNDIFDAERLQSGTFQIKKSDCHTQKIMTDAIAQVQELAKQADIKINVSPDTYALHADSDRLVQVLINLLSNAIKFSPPSSTIDLSVEQQTPYLLFTVRDQGRGIPQQELEIIFERFKQIDSSDARDKEGAGLGLAISKEIVEQHGGKIWVESTLGKGSNFYFTVRDY
ncbi:MAG: PAS domain S-box protein, partial [Snowella sp.]|nr:PAS domain S-box protein [Snowella sp.]